MLLLCLVQNAKHHNLYKVITNTSAVEFGHLSDWIDTQLWKLSHTASLSDARRYGHLDHLQIYHLDHLGPLSCRYDMSCRICAVQIQRREHVLL